MNPEIHPDPEWQSYADRIIARLIAQQNAEGESRNQARYDTHDQAHRSAREDADHDAERAGSGDPDADAEPALGRAFLSPQRLSLVLRLAATFGNEEALHRAAAPGAVTMVTGCDPDEVELIRQYVRTGTFAPDLPVTLRLRHHSTDGELLLLGPDASGGAIRDSARRSFLRQLDDALERSGGLILLVPEPSVLPAVLQPEASPGVTHLRLAPLDRSLLMAQLRHSHSHGLPDDAAEAALREALPDDGRLAALPPAALRLALRAADAQGVAERVTALSAPRRTEGPRLESMTGNSEALRTARRLVTDLRLWQDGRIAWTDLSRSMLLYGPTGTGKTWLARAMGASAGVAMVEASFAEWQAAGHLGDMLREMRESFAAARRRAPAILFIDEIDAVGSREGSDSHGSRYQMQVINGFLGEMDSIGREPGVIVIGACNHPSRIDPAVLRPGRFDLKVAVPLPDRAAIRGMLQHHLGAGLADAALESLATAAVGASAAEIDAAIRAARSEAREEGMPLSPEMITRHMGISLDAGQAAFDWRAAVHECGHAVVGTALGCGVITRLLLTPAGGEIHLRLAPREGVLPDIEAQIAYALAGRAAEGLVLGRLSAGAGGPAASDLALATRLALHVETRLGLGDDGPLWTDAPDHERLADPRIRARVGRRLEAAETRAAAILAEHESLLRQMAAAALRERELTGPALERWLEEVTPRIRPCPGTSRSICHPASAAEDDPTPEAAG